MTDKAKQIPMEGNNDRQLDQMEKLCPLMLMSRIRGGLCLGKECSWWYECRYDQSMSGCVLAVGNECDQANYELLRDIESMVEGL